MNRNFILLSVLGMAVLLVLSASSVFSGKSKGNTNEPPPEYIIYTYELKSEKLAALQQRYWAADEATKKELCWEIGRLIGFSDVCIRGELRHGVDSKYSFICSIMRNTGGTVTVSKRYLVSDGKGNVENVTEEEAYHIAAEIDVAREAEFHAQIQELIRK